MRMVLPINLLGLASYAVPVGKGLASYAVPVGKGKDDWLPQGVQLIAARFRDDILLDAAQSVEDRAPRLTPIQCRVAMSV